MRPHLRRPPDRPKIFRDVRDIVRRSHALHGRKDFMNSRNSGLTPPPSAPAPSIAVARMEFTPTPLYRFPWLRPRPGIGAQFYSRRRVPALASRPLTRLDTATLSRPVPPSSLSAHLFPLFYLNKLDGLRERLVTRAATASARIASAVHCAFFRPNSTSGTFPRTKKRKKRSTLKSTR
jgi:hypothetical protein